MTLLIYRTELSHWLFEASPCGAADNDMVSDHMIWAATVTQSHFLGSAKVYRPECHKPIFSSILCLY
jgi:hypothetical protein